MGTVVFGSFEWDDAKAAKNVARHSIEFDEAATVFADPNVVFLTDGSGDGQLVAIGLSTRGRILLVVHIERGERDRLISARSANANEQTAYHGG